MERKKTSTTLEANRRCSVKLVFRLMANAKQKRESRPSALWPRCLVLLHSAMRILSNHGLGSVREWQKEAQRRAKEEEKEDEEEEERESEKQHSEARGDGDVFDFSSHLGQTSTFEKNKLDLVATPPRNSIACSPNCL